MTGEASAKMEAQDAAGLGYEGQAREGEREREKVERVAGLKVTSIFEGERVNPQLNTMSLPRGEES